MITEINSNVKDRKLKNSIPLWSWQDLAAKIIYTKKDIWILTCYKSNKKKLTNNFTLEMEPTDPPRTPSQRYIFILFFNNNVTLINISWLKSDLFKIKYLCCTFHYQVMPCVVVMLQKKLCDDPSLKPGSMN